MFCNLRLFLNRIHSGKGVIPHIHNSFQIHNQISFIGMNAYQYQVVQSVVIQEKGLLSKLSSKYWLINRLFFNISQALLLTGQFTYILQLKIAERPATKAKMEVNQHGNSGPPTLMRTSSNSNSCPHHTYQQPTSAPLRSSSSNYVSQP